MLKKVEEKSSEYKESTTNKQVDLVADVKRKFEREKALMMDENKRTRTELEKVWIN